LWAPDPEEILRAMSGNPHRLEAAQTAGAEHRLHFERRHAEALRRLACRRDNAAFRERDRRYKRSKIAASDWLKG
jgi:hypothetical protein